MPGYAAYMICTTPRSGSTLLCKLLAATGVAGQPDSHFHTPSLARWLKTFDLVRADLADDASAVSAVLKAAQARGTGTATLFGLRMQQGSFAYFTSQLARAFPEAACDTARIEAAFGKTLFLHLTRASKLDQAISRVKAAQTGLWHRHADGTELERQSPARAPIYDAGQIAAQMADLSARDAAWARWFDIEGVVPMHLSYDALSCDPSAVLADVLGALGQDPAIAGAIRPAAAKLADATNRAWAARFLAERGPDTAAARPSSTNLTHR